MARHMAALMHSSSAAAEGTSSATKPGLRPIRHDPKQHYQGFTFSMFVFQVRKEVKYTPGRPEVLQSYSAVRADEEGESDAA